MKTICAGIAGLIISVSAMAADNVGQCIYPKTKPAKNGRLAFQKPVYIFATPDAKEGQLLKTFESFKVGSQQGALVQLLSVPDYDKPNPDQDAGKVVGWAKLADFTMQELRNCN